MKTVSPTTRKRIEMQGFVNLNDRALADFGPWLRLATGICATWAAIATAFGSAFGLWALVPIAAAGAILTNHPFDAIYNYGIRHALGTRPIPRSPAPRRFACAVATPWLASAGLAFVAGVETLGYVLGGSLVLAASVPTTTDFCIPSFFYGLIFGRPAARATAKSEPSGA
jgi:hypothetical protein